MGYWKIGDNIKKLNIINGPVMWIDSILIYLFSLIYIVSAIQSKQEVVLKVSFSVFAILFNMITISIWLLKFLEYYKEYVYIKVRTGFLLFNFKKNDIM